MTDNNPDAIKIAEMQKEIEKLKIEKLHLLQRLEEDSVGGKIRESLRFIDTAAIMKSLMDQKSFLQLLLSMTIKVVNSEAASIILFDPNSEELFFEEAVGVKAEEVKKFRLKPWEGIAGYCFTTGEALAVADVMKDARFKKEIAETIQHKQKALMAAPLIYRQEIIGVLETVNKIDCDAFSSKDLNLLVQIANFSAFFLRRSRLYFDLYSLFLLIVEKLASRDNISDISAKDFIELSNLIEKDQMISSEYAEAIELAALVEQISSRGQEEKNLIRSILDNLNHFISEKYHYNSQNETDWMINQ